MKNKTLIRSKVPNTLLRGRIKRIAGKAFLAAFLAVSTPVLISTAKAQTSSNLTLKDMLRKHFPYKDSDTTMAPGLIYSPKIWNARKNRDIHRVMERIGKEDTNFAKEFITILAKKASDVKYRLKYLHFGKFLKHLENYAISKLTSLKAVKIIKMFKKLFGKFERIVSLYETNTQVKLRRIAELSGEETAIKMLKDGKFQILYYASKKLIEKKFKDRINFLDNSLDAAISSLENAKRKNLNPSKEQIIDLFRYVVHTKGDASKIANNFGLTTNELNQFSKNTELNRKISEVETENKKLLKKELFHIGRVKVDVQVVLNILKFLGVLALIIIVITFFKKIGKKD